MITTILWDLDGTILDSFQIHEKLLAQILPKYGRKVPPKEVLLQNYHGRLKDTIANILDDASMAEVDTILKEYLLLDDMYMEEVDSHLFEDALRLAKRAAEKEVTQIIVTNRISGVGRLNGSPHNIIRNSSLNELISVAVCGDEVVQRKPHPAVLDVIKDRHVVVPEETLVIGDQFVDAQFAHNLGAQGVVVCRHDVVHHLEKLRDGWQEHVKIVQSLDEVEKYFMHKGWCL